MSTENKSGLMQAIFNVQQQAGYLKKESSGQVGQGKFKYSNLTSTWDSVKQLLKDNEIVVYGSPTSSDERGITGNYYKNTLHHLPSGEEKTEYMMMVLTRQDPQAVGAAITYYRRYMTTTQLGLIPDDDNDAREQRLATAQQKLQIVGAVKMTFNNDGKEWRPEDINNTIQNIIGKHPSQIRESEAEQVVELIRAYSDSGSLDTKEK